MLALSRKANECVIIGQDIEVRVLDVSWKKVKLQISGPRDDQIDQVTLTAGDQVSIRPDIKVSIAELYGNRARIGFEAPREISIRREEVPAPSD